MASATSSLLLLLALAAPAWPQPAVEGSWEHKPSWPLAASHAALLSNGRVLLWNDIGASPVIWDPVGNSFTSAQHPSVPLPGVRGVQLGNGDVALVGGRDGNGMGSTAAWQFAHGGPTWTPLANMQQPRDRPGALLVGDARVFVVGGDRQPGVAAELPERALPGDPWNTVLAASLALPKSSWAFALANGTILVAGPDATARTLNENTQQWSVVDDMLLGAREAGSAVMVPGFPQQFLVAGGRSPASATCERIDLDGGGGWIATGNLAHARRHHNLTLLADGSVLATGGTLVGNELQYSVYATECYAPDTGTWTTLSNANVSRRAHSVALLLPDGRVVVAGGGDGSAGSELHADASVFSPPYLFQGPRPTITAAPDSIRYQGVYTVSSPEADNIEAVWLVRAGAVTAGFNSDQRALSLPFTAVAGELTFSAPDSAGIAPPGTWMLFLVDDAGVPSEAAILRMHAGPPVLPLPSITTAAPTTGQVGVMFVYQAQASGGQPISWSLSQAPAWMGVNSINGIVTGVPAQDGNHNVTLRATNVEGYDEESWVLVVDPANQTPQTVVPLGATWRYFKGNANPGASWAQPSYDDSSWLQGISGFGFGDGDDATVLNDMHDNYTTVFTRTTFPLAQASSVSRVSVLFDYDDGFAVYLNGTRITSRGAPATITHQTTATSAHEATGVFERDDFTNGATLALLQNGTNVLAAVGINRSIGSSDLTLKIALEIAGGGAIAVDADDAWSRLPVQVRPNPFAGGTSVAFALTLPGTARLEIFDVHGRRVHVQQQALGAGPQVLRWDGRDAHGQSAAAGIYPYRLTAPGVDVSGKMTRLTPLAR